MWMKTERQTAEHGLDLKVPGQIGLLSRRRHNLQQKPGGIIIFGNPCRSCHLFLIFSTVNLLLKFGSTFIIINSLSILRDRIIRKREVHLNQEQETNWLACPGVSTRPIKSRTGSVGALWGTARATVRTAASSNRTFSITKMQRSGNTRHFRTATTLHVATYTQPTGLPTPPPSKTSTTTYTLSINNRYYDFRRDIRRLMKIFSFSVALNQKNR